MLDEAFALCSHCGDTFFKEHLVNGKCKVCIDGHIPIYNANNNTED